jgi:hypothetical protein
MKPNSTGNLFQLGSNPQANPGDDPIEVQGNHYHNRLSQNHIARESINTIECQQINGFMALRRNPLIRRSAKPRDSSNAIYSPISLLNEDGQTSTFKSGRAIEHGHLKK